jgi:hypothetical protein
LAERGESFRRVAQGTGVLGIVAQRRLSELQPSPSRPTVWITGPADQRLRRRRRWRLCGGQFAGLNPRGLAALRL